MIEYFEGGKMKNTKKFRNSAINTKQTPSQFSKKSKREKKYEKAAISFEIAA